MSGPYNWTSQHIAKTEVGTVTERPLSAKPTEALAAG